MKGVKSILWFCLVSACCCSTLLAQPLGSLREFYSALSRNHHTSDDGLRTSNYYPLKAANFVWSISTWNFTDTTTYVYTATDQVASLTRKNSSNFPISRILNSYDASDNLIEALHQNWLSGWTNDFRDTFAFDVHNNLTLQENYNWTTQWDLAGGYRYFYTYNPGGKILTKLTVSWNTTTLVWDSVSLLTHTYNAGDQVIQTIGSSYNQSLNAWELISKRDFTYNASSVNTQTTDYLWNGSAWINNTRLINIVWNTWTGDINTSDPLNYIYQLWISSAWNDYNRLTYTYDAFGSSILLTELFVSGNWRNDARLSDFYDNQYNYIGTRSESWNVVTTSWDTSYEYKYIHTYDASNTIIETIYQQYDIFNHLFVNNSRTVYSEFVLLDVEENISKNNSAIKIYPNPVTDVANIIMPEEKMGSFQYRIFNSTGNLVRAGEEKKNNFRIARDGLAEGLYLLLVSDDQGAHHVLRFIVQ